jgi:hypothetical protein
MESASLHDLASEAISSFGTHYVDCVKGANIAGFIEVADMMIAYGF